MPRYLVLADQTAHSVELMERLRQIATAHERAEFVLVVPATPVRHLLFWEEGSSSPGVERPTPARASPPPASA